MPDLGTVDAPNWPGIQHEAVHDGLRSWWYGLTVAEQGARLMTGCERCWPELATDRGDSVSSAEQATEGEVNAPCE